MHPDVVIAGGGPAGCALAIALAQRGIRSTIVAKGDRSRSRPGEMLQPAARELVAELGLDLSGHLRAYGVSSAWESDALAQNDFFIGTQGDGWLLDRYEFDEALATYARNLGVTFTRERDFVGAFVVDATGSTAAIARACGARRVPFDQLAGVFTIVDVAGEADGFTRIEAVEQGWWYSAYVPGGRMAVALMSDGDMIRAGKLSDPERWRAALDATRHTRERVGNVELRERLQVRSAASALLAPVAGDGWLAIGDAASVWDPLSASGIYKALRNAVDAADAIAGGSVDAYAHSVQVAFHEYLDMRDRYYALVQRFPDSLFWQRRQRAITLDPMTVLRTHDASRAAFARIDPRLRIADIPTFCRDGQRAHDVVTACAPQHGDTTVILALQAMLREGVLVG